MGKEPTKVEANLSYPQLRDKLTSDIKAAGLDGVDELEARMDTLDKKFEEWQSASSAEREKAEEANRMRAAFAGAGGASQIQASARTDKTLTDLAQLLPFMAKAGTSHTHMQDSAIKLAQSKGYDDVVKTLEAADYDAAGVLLPTRRSDEWTQALFANNVVRQLGARTLDISEGPLDIGKTNVTPTAGWAGEGVRMTVSEGEYGEQTLTPHKAYVLVPISNELLDRLPAGMETLIRDDMEGVIQNLVDLAYIRGSGANDTPMGILNQTASGNKFDATDSPTLSDIADALIKAQYLVFSGLEGNVSQPGWMFHSRSKYELMSVRTSDGFPVYQDELANGNLFGHPYGVSNQIPVDKTGDGDETEIYFGDFSNVVVGTSNQMTVTQSSSASFVDSNSNTVHGFQDDITLMKITMYTDLVQRRDDAFGIIENWDLGNELDA